GSADGSSTGGSADGSLGSGPKPTRDWALPWPVIDRYYSMYGHVEKLAHEIQKGAESVKGVEAKLWQVPEILSEEVLKKMSAPPKSDVPIITTNELGEADGYIFGFPTTFGMMAAQFKVFIHATGGLWKRQQLNGKPAGVFYSTSTQGGGQESTPGVSNYGP
ncbi:probable NAD(P)H dehydrogenase FQR1-like protein 1, partial [Tanacetum coccineum]